MFALSLVDVGLPTHLSRQGIFISCVGQNISGLVRESRN